MTNDAAQTNGPWRVHGGREVFDNPWLTLVDYRVTHPDGRDGDYGVVRFKNRAIGVLPVDEEGCVYLVGQHRFPLGRYSWEAPEGGAPKSEDPLEGAKRELKEETGLTARGWAPLAAFDVSNSVTDEEAVCFLAWGLEAGESAPDPTEILKVRRIPFAALLEEVLTGRIRDSLTIVMALAAQARALRGELPVAISSAIGYAVDKQGTERGL
ncbi:MAG: NUDIX domain-containing protein [Alphaproteobacteria bacterium]|nr:NUDIX domain-containing protein [Alphaproteobacteria bacterium]